MDLPKLWELIEADLVRARGTLREDAASHKAVRDYQDFLDKNEFGLACDTLETYAQDHQVTREFWLTLHDAATKMQLPNANRFERFAGNTETKS
jgi:hypothetical protein